MRLQSRERDGIFILDLSGKLMGGQDADTFREELHKLLDKGVKKVLVNLQKVSWVNSTGIGILISGYSTLRKNGGDLKLLHISDRIKSILYITKLNLIFESFDDEDEALKSFETI